jgi:hypothetical protein
MTWQVLSVRPNLVGAFDRNYSGIVDGNRGHIGNFFTQIRELEDRYYEVGATPYCTGARRAASSTASETLIS